MTLYYRQKVTKMENLQNTVALLQELQAVLQDKSVKRILQDDVLVIEIRQPADYLMTRKEVRERLKIGENTTTSLIKNGVLKPIFLPGDRTMKFRSSDIESLIKRGVRND